MYALLGLQHEASRGRPAAHCCRRRVAYGWLPHGEPTLLPELQWAKGRDGVLCLCAPCSPFALECRRHIPPACLPSCSAGRQPMCRSRLPTARPRCCTTQTSRWGPGPCRGASQASPAEACCALARGPARAACLPACAPSRAQVTDTLRQPPALARRRCPTRHLLHLLHWRPSSMLVHIKSLLGELAAPAGRAGRGGQEGGRGQVQKGAGGVRDAVRPRQGKPEGRAGQGARCARWSDGRWWLWWWVVWWLGVGDGEARRMHALDSAYAGRMARHVAQNAGLPTLQRREYDSTDDFDDSLPTECAPADFYKVCPRFALLLCAS